MFDKLQRLMNKRQARKLKNSMRNLSNKKKEYLKKSTRVDEENKN